MDSMHIGTFIHSQDIKKLIFTSDDINFWYHEYMFHKSEMNITSEN